MSSTLESDAVATTLERLLTAEDKQDLAAAWKAAGVDLRGEFPAEMSAAEMAERTKDIIMSVSRPGGQLLYLLTRTLRARTVVEFGTSFGISTLYLAAAVRDNGGGQVITTELQPDKARQATENFAAAGLADLVDVRLGDARETLRELPDDVDMLLLDGWLDLRLPILRVVEPRLRPGALVVIDDVDLDIGRGVYAEFRDYISDPANGYFSLTLPVHQGVQLALKLG
ncbi:O-methyltransferase [Paractinoplanes lichenicola]|uniref:Class I SAM-dependent methyltransferase n=1 Tax=Paractinoplanes lichenicola TaxID=2802976 RepID=A0ABS1W083_9ACTN|nr:class I SAM-dependent methyltransferase [Actinoplanes lichenicola]MBL7260144.1 class I SAM-dependent methyltransferase [Actinoplanes lichenicola]